MHNLMTVKETAEYLRIPLPTVYYLVQRGQLPAIQIGGRWRIKKASLDKDILKEDKSGQPTVLVVDDDESALKLADKTLRALGYRAVCRQDVTSALSAAAKEHPAAVILDVVIPEINGFEFLKRFRNTQAGRRTPVIVWTGKDLTSAERRHLQSTADSVVMKSEVADELLRELKDCFERRTVTRKGHPGRDLKRIIC